MNNIIELTKHKINLANDKLRVFVLDEKGQGGAYHVYAVLIPLLNGAAFMESSNFVDYNLNSKIIRIWPFLGFAKIIDTSEYFTVNLISFQNGPIKEFGVNGFTHEVLLAIIEHRLECFQSGPFNNKYNQKALEHTEEARMWLQARTVDRIIRDVEGTNKQ